MSGFLLHTPIITEMFQPKPDRDVLKWIESQRAGALFLTAMSLGELVRHVRSRARGADRANLERWVNQDLAEQFEGRILPFDAESAALWGSMVAELEAKPRAAAELQVAAVAIRHGFKLVTNNAKAFRGANVELVDLTSG